MGSDCHLSNIAVRDPRAGGSGRRHKSLPCGWRRDWAETWAKSFENSQFFLKEFSKGAIRKGIKRLRNEVVHQVVEDKRRHVGWIVERTHSIACRCAIVCRSCCSEASILFVPSWSFFVSFCALLR